MKKDLMTGAILVAEAVAAAGALSAVNVAKSNTNRGTYAIGANKTTGDGGLDIDLAVGAVLVIGAAFAPSGIAPHLAALGIGGLATAGARMGAKYGAKKGQSVPGIPPGHGYLRAFEPRQMAGQPDPFVSRYGWQHAGEHVPAGAHRF